MTRSRIVWCALFLLAAGSAVADQVAANSHRGTMMRVTVTNLTPGQGFSPALVVAHNADFRMFTIGQPASAGVARIAEEGDPSVAMQENAGNANIAAMEVAGEMPFMPGESVSVEVPWMWPHAYISVLGMLGTTNDAFYALNAHRVDAIRTVLYVHAYDAGSERNSEDCDFVPGPPCGSMGVRDTEGAEGRITIHGGIHGVGDLEPSRLDWRNPVAMITIEQVLD